MKRLAWLILILPLSLWGQYSISGTVSGPGNTGVTMTLWGPPMTAGKTTTTDASGNYTFTNLPPELSNTYYCVGIGKIGYTFSPLYTCMNVTNANVTGANFTSTAAAATYTVSGPCWGAAGITMSLVPGIGTAGGYTAGAIATTTTTINGYQFTGIPNGTYVVVPSLTGTIFWGPAMGVTVNGANATPSGNCIPITVGASLPGTGRIYGNVVAGVTINVIDLITGAAVTSVVSDLTGAYTVNLPFGNYYMTPSLSGYTFNPSYQAEGLYENDNTCGPNCWFAPSYTALLITPVVYNITGQITGAAQLGVQMALSGSATGATASTAAGTYGFANLAPGAYTVTPSLQGFTFSPGSAPVTITNASVSGVNFAATATTQGGGGGTELSVACICPANVAGRAVPAKAPVKATGKKP